MLRTLYWISPTCVFTTTLLTLLTLLSLISSDVVEAFGLLDRGKVRHNKKLNQDCLEENQSRGLPDTVL